LDTPVLRSRIYSIKASIAFNVSSLQPWIASSKEDYSIGC
jgi:hypothetical protein